MQPDSNKLRKFSRALRWIVIPPPPTPPSFHFHFFGLVFFHFSSSPSPALQATCIIQTYTYIKPRASALLYKQKRIFLLRPRITFFGVTYLYSSVKQVTTSITYEIPSKTAILRQSKYLSARRRSC